MVDADVTPVAIPLTTGKPAVVTVPAETHVMYWCRLRPVVRDEELTAQERQRQRSRLFHSLLDDVDIGLTVDGDPVHLVGEVIRPDGDREYGFWNLEEPLSSGRHAVSVSLTAPDETTTDGDHPLTYRQYPADEAVRLTSEGDATGETTIRAIETEPERFQSDSDPFWNRRDVYVPRRGQGSE